MFISHENARASGVAVKVWRFPSRSTASGTCRPSGVSCTSRVNWRALRTRSPSYSTTTSPALRPAFSAGLSRIYRVDPDAAGLVGGVQVLNHHAETAAPAVEAHQLAALASRLHFPAASAPCAASAGNGGHDGHRQQADERPEPCLVGLTSRDNLPSSPVETTVAGGWLGRGLEA